jgi:UDP-N-acetylmuramate--alanine ligase
MLNSIDFSGRPFHFIGVGGIGMSALALVLAEQGLPVSGSDVRLTHITERLKSVGVNIFLSQEAANLEYFKLRVPIATSVPVGAVASSSLGLASRAEPEIRSADQALPQVICSTAIGPTNPEYRAALDLGCPIFHRSDVLAGLIAQHQSISVAGTHGKTTTSSLIGHLLLASGLDPTVVVGGEVASLGGNARVGKGPYLVAEADESDGSLVKFRSYVGIITNIELDHTDHYSDLDHVVQTFQNFAQRCQTLIGCIDCAVTRERLRPEITYSLHRESGADYSVDSVHYDGHSTTAQVWERGLCLGQLQLQLLGQHNLSNALAAVAVGRLLGLDFSAIAAGMASFAGARRRFEVRGEVNQIRLIDDYAHHPSELRVTLAAARLQANAEGRRLVAIFQPHRYSRTLTFLPEFAAAFVDADLVVVSDIYSAGEADRGDINSQQLAAQIASHQAAVHQAAAHLEARDLGHSDGVHYQPTLLAVREFLKQTLRPGDLAIFLGAGNLNQVIPELLADLSG